MQRKPTMMARCFLLWPSFTATAKGSFPVDRASHLTEAMSGSPLRSCYVLELFLRWGFLRPGPPWCEAFTAQGQLKANRS